MATTAPASAQADRIQMIYGEEVTYGTILPTSTEYGTLRLTSESLQKTTESVVSGEIRADRQNVDVIRTGIGAGGDINFELSYATFDDYFRWALMSAETDVGNAPGQEWSGLVVYAAAAADVSVTSGTDLFARVVDFSASIQLNTWIKTSGFVETANNGIFKILSSADAKSITITQTGVLVTEVAPAAATVTGASQIVNGTTFWSHSLQKEFTDLTGDAQFEDFTSLSVNTMALNVPVDGIITGTFGLIGKTAVSSNARLDDNAADANTNEVMSAVEDVQKILENSAAYGSMGFTLNLNNNLRQRAEIGTLGAVSVGAGSIDLTGNIQAYFATQNAMDRYLNFTSSNIAIVFADSVGNNYVIDIPEVKYTDGKRVAGGRNTDIIADLSWTAKRDPTEGITIRMAKFTA